MVDLNCPNCGSSSLTVNANKDKAYCLQCKGTFELTKVNAWYKKTILEMRNMEFDKQ